MEPMGWSQKCKPATYGTQAWSIKCSKYLKKNLNKLNPSLILYSPGPCTASQVLLHGMREKLLDLLCHSNFKAPGMPAVCILCPLVDYILGKQKMQGTGDAIFPMFASAVGVVRPAFCKLNYLIIESREGRCHFQMKASEMWVLCIANGGSTVVVLLPHISSEQIVAQGLFF